jgi:integrase
MWGWHPKNGYQQRSGAWYRQWRRKLGIPKDFHGLRHTWETALRDAGVSETLAAELAGHAKGETQSFSRYAKTGHLENLREAIDKLPVNPGRRA